MKPWAFHIRLRQPMLNKALVPKRREEHRLHPKAIHRIVGKNNEQTFSVSTLTLHYFCPCYLSLLFHHQAWSCKWSPMLLKMTEGILHFFSKGRVFSFSFLITRKTCTEQNNTEISIQKTIYSSDIHSVARRLWKRGNNSSCVNVNKKMRYPPRKMWKT